MTMSGDFNESACSAKMQNFMNETGSFGVFQEINGVEPEKEKIRLSMEENSWILC